MILYHVTTKASLPGIRARGLDPQKSRGKAARVWLVTLERVQWAILHVLARHDARLLDVAVLSMDMSGIPVKQFGMGGLLYADMPVAPCRIIKEGDWLEFVREDRE